MSAESVPEVFVELVKLAERRGVRRINALAGCWEFTLPGGWFVAVNGHAEPVECSRGVKVPPFRAYVESHGLPAGLVSPRGGEFVVYEDVNEDAFLDALRGAL